MPDLRRAQNPFKVISPYQPSGDQPQAIAEITKRLNAGEKDIILLGATGTGKSATTAWLIEQIQRPTLILEPNKTLAAQMAAEFRQLLPNNAVEYFVSYYDYYQPEAYIPQTDTFIEKDSSINDEVERLRHSATNSLLTRRDTVVVASVSCIYGLGTPKEYVARMVPLQVGQEIDRDTLLHKFVAMQYTRNDIDFTRGTFRVRGDTIEIIPMYEELAIRIEMFGDEIENLATLHPITGNVINQTNNVYIFPASHYVAGEQRMKQAIQGIETELTQRLKELQKTKQTPRSPTPQNAHHLRPRNAPTSRHLLRHRKLLHAHRRPPTRPTTPHPPRLLPRRLPTSHRRIPRHHPQIGAMYEGDASRKRILIDHGFRLPSAADNRPLKFNEFEQRIGQTLYLSATPGKYEQQRLRHPRRTNHPPHRTT